MNKIGLYIRQAWTLLRQNKLYSGIYIAGTALSIALAMVICIVTYVIMLVTTLIGTLIPVSRAVTELPADALRDE